MKLKKNKIIGIYKITSPSGKIYIGQSVDVNSRFASYARKSCADQPKLFNSIEKYGYSNHIFEIVCECERHELDANEIFYICYFNTIKEGLNCKGGGARGTLSKESLIKLSDSLKITNKKPEVKERRSAWQRGRKMSDEFKASQSLRKTGLIGHPNQIKSAIGNNYAQKEPIEIFKDEISVSIQDNLYKAAEFVGGDFRNVHACLKGKRSRHMGYSFKRIYEGSSTAVA